MNQIHRRCSDEQIRVLLQGYCQGTLARDEIQVMLGIGKTRFFSLVKAYRQDPVNFSLVYRRYTPARLPVEVEEQISYELLREKELVDDPRLPISGYNYSALRDRLKRKGINVSATTITARAKGLGCYKPRPKAKVHDREVVTAAIGALVQHDASVHLWSPLADQKWVLITSLDDYSRKLLFADFFAQESTWAHIQAAQSLIQAYGVPLRYYTDNLRVFRFVQHRDSVWRNHALETDEADPQWRQVMRLLGVEVIYALSPQAKGKIERTYRWLQDRIVRTCALDHLTTLPQARAVLQEEIDRYNNRQVHATTGEIPSIRFEKAQQTGNSLFRPFSPPQPYTSPKDVFCLRLTRTVNGYRRISLFNQQIQVPNVLPHDQVEIHLLPDATKDMVEIRIWCDEHMVHTVTYPMQNLAVHF